MLEPAVVKPSGDLDIASVDEFRKELDDATLESEETLIVDLSDVGFMDSTGLRVILETNERLRREHRSVAVVAPRGTAAAVEAESWRNGARGTRWGGTVTPGGNLDNGGVAAQAAPRQGG